MVIEATKRHREMFAFGLLGVAALYFLSALSLLFKSGDDLGGAGFADKASLFGYVFTHPVLVIALFGAVALVTGFGENSKNARSVVLTALGLGALALVFGVICWLAAFGAESAGLSVFNGVVGAGKVVGVFLGLAQLGFLGLATFYAFTAFQTFPKPVRAQQQQWGQQPPGWGQPGGYDQAQGAQQQGWGQQPAGYDQAPPAGWGQQSGWSQQAQQAQQGGYDQAQQSWGQPQGQSGGYDQAQQSWGQPPGQQGQPPAQPAQPSTWGQADASAGSWGTPAAASWGEQAQPEDPPQGQPASSWEELSTPVTTNEPSSDDETQVWHSGDSEPAGPGDEVEPGGTDAEADDPRPSQQGWWQQPGS